MNKRLENFDSVSTVIIFYGFQQRLSFTESISRRVDEQSYSSDEESASVKVVTKNISTDEDSGAVSNAYAAYKGN